MLFSFAVSFTAAVAVADCLSLKIE